jgi:hypothetical protein
MMDHDDMPGYARRLWQDMQDLPANGFMLRIKERGFVVWQRAYRDRGGGWNLYDASKRHSESAGTWLLMKGYARLDGDMLVATDKASG